MFSEMLDRVRECMGRALKLDAAAVAGVSESSTAADVPGWTSVGHLSLVLELEKTFGVHFGNDEIVSMGSVSAIVERLADKGAT
jgi:acyl carrier protein